MGLADKIKQAEESTWLYDSLTEEERRTAAFVASVAVAIQQQRRDQGLTQKQLADKLGVSQIMVSQWENGDVNFTVATLARISLALGLSLENPIMTSAVEKI